MAVIYLARSKTVSNWGASVGISKNLFKVGVTDETGKEAVAALSDEVYAGASDWTLVKAAAAAALSEADVFDRLTQKAMAVDPKYYPRLRDTHGVIRIKPEQVENHVLLEKALTGVQDLNLKIKAADFAAYVFKIVGDA